jgi:high affinity Mn2+ porin
MSFGPSCDCGKSAQVIIIDTDVRTNIVEGNLLYSTLGSDLRREEELSRTEVYQSEKNSNLCNLDQTKYFLLYFLSIAVAAILLILLTTGQGQTDEIQNMRELKQKVQDIEGQLEHTDKHLIHRPETEALARILDGFKLELGLTGVLQGSSGADDLAGSDQIDASGSLDLEVQKKFGDIGTAFIMVESRQGQGLTNEIGTFHGVNADAVADRANLKITEAWYEYSFAEVPLILTIGKIDLTNYFDNNAVANDETLQFLANGFVNNIAVEFPVDNGPGFRLACFPSEQLEIGLGVGESDADFEDVDRDPFGILEFSYRHRFGELQGNYRFYSWINAAEHQEWTDPLKDHSKNWGLGISFDQAISRKLTGFLRAGIQNDSVSQVHTTLSLGAEFRGLFPEKEEDVLGLAFGIARPSDKYADSVAPSKLDYEQMVEAYYSFHVNDHLILSPDLQVTRNPAGLADADTVTVLGFRAQMLF